MHLEEVLRLLSDDLCGRGGRLALSERGNGKAVPSQAAP